MQKTASKQPNHSNTTWLILNILPGKLNVKIPRRFGIKFILSESDSWLKWKQNPTAQTRSSISYAGKLQLMRSHRPIDAKTNSIRPGRITITANNWNLCSDSISDSKGGIKWFKSEWDYQKGKIKKTDGKQTFRLHWLDVPVCSANSFSLPKW